MRQWRRRAIATSVGVLAASLVATAIVLTTGGGQLTGTVIDERGAAVPSCSVAPEGPTFHGREFGVLSSIDGWWSFGEVRNGPYIVRVICPAAFKGAGAEGRSGSVLVHGDTHVSVVVHPSQ